jgi:GT2 family glycosyltransferase
MKSTGNSRLQIFYDKAVFVLLSSSPDPRQDARVLRLARLLEKRGQVFIVSVHPRCAEFEADADSLEALLRRLTEQHPPKLLFALDAAAAAAILAHRFLSAIAWVLSPVGPRWDGELAEQAFHARELWIARDSKSIPRELRSRAAIMPSLRATDFDAWIERRLGKLLDAPQRALPSYPPTSLVIPVYNGRELLKDCVESIKRHTTAPYELILVNNASDAATTRYLRGLRGVRLIHNDRNLGFARAVNQGMAAARGRYVGWINSDTLCGPEWLERMIDCLQSDPMAAAAGPMTNRSVGSQVVKLRRDAGCEPKAFDRYARAWSMMHDRQRREAHRLTGFFTLFKRRAVEAVGQLDERFGTGCYEDYDYCLRLRQAGFKLLVAMDVFVQHREHASFGSKDNFDRQCEANKAIFVKKWCEHSLEFLDQIDSELAYEPRARTKPAR